MNIYIDRQIDRQRQLHYTILQLQLQLQLHYRYNYNLYLQGLQVHFRFCWTIGSRMSLQYLVVESGLLKARELAEKGRCEEICKEEGTVQWFPKNGRKKNMGIWPAPAKNGSLTKETGVSAGNSRNLANETGVSSHQQWGDRISKIGNITWRKPLVEPFVLCLPFNPIRSKKSPVQSTVWSKLIDIVVNSIHNIQSL